MRPVRKDRAFLLDRDEAVITLKGLVDEVGLVLQAEGFALPPELKRRDTREPGRRRKQEAEDRMVSKLSRFWRGQKQRVRDQLESYYPARKAVTDFIGLDDAFWDGEGDDLAAELFQVLTQAGKDGVRLFGEQVTVGIDYSKVDARVAEKAREYVYELVAGINSTTRQALQNAIAAFAETPGMTIGDVIGMLPYDEARAVQIATTEITRAYASAAQEAGEMLAEDFPGVDVVTTWWTNVDDRVCPICAPLDGAETPIDEPFVGGDGESYPFPPAHPGCRCWVSSSTA
jgi:hypothetical protein